MSNKKEPLITPTTMALEKAVDLVQDKIDEVHKTIKIDPDFKWETQDVLSMLGRLKQDIIERNEPQRKPAQVPVSSTVYMQKTEEEIEDSWRASPDRSGGQFTTEEINEDLLR